MKVFSIINVFVAVAVAQNGCGFPDGPDCISLGRGAGGLEQFIDDPCCLLPIRCGNTAGERCERVAGGSTNTGNTGNSGAGRTRGRKRRNNNLVKVA